MFDLVTTETLARDHRRALLECAEQRRLLLTRPHTPLTGWFLTLLRVAQSVEASNTSPEMRASEPTSARRSTATSRASSGFQITPSR